MDDNDPAHRRAVINVGSHPWRVALYAPMASDAQSLAKFLRSSGFTVVIEQDSWAGS